MDPVTEKKCDAVDVGKRVRVVKGKHAGANGSVVEVLKGGWIRVRRDNGDVVSVQGKGSMQPLQSSPYGVEQRHYVPRKPAGKSQGFMRRPLSEMSSNKDSTYVEEDEEEVDEDDDNDEDYSEDEAANLEKELKLWRARSAAKREQLQKLRRLEAERRQQAEQTAREFERQQRYREAEIEREEAAARELEREEAAARELERQRAAQLAREKERAQRLREAARALRKEKEAAERKKKLEHENLLRRREQKRRDEERRKKGAANNTSNNRRYPDFSKASQQRRFFPEGPSARPSSSTFARDQKEWPPRPPKQPRRPPAESRLSKARHFKVLELQFTARTPEIKRQFRELARQHHPDKHPGRESNGTATEIMAKINEAFAVLKNAETREKYKKAVLAGQAK